MDGWTARSTNPNNGLTIAGNTCHAISSPAIWKTGDVTELTQPDGGAFWYENPDDGGTIERRQWYEVERAQQDVERQENRKHFSRECLAVAAGCADDVLEGDDDRVPRRHRLRGRS